MTAAKPRLNLSNWKTNSLNAFESSLEQFKNQFDNRARDYFSTLAKSARTTPVLEESKKYSFFSGGKRFRPFLSFLTGQTLQQNFDAVFPVALATEMIHTYSLIHDDLPCMDNDDFRRGQPTNHKKFGEDIALLAGDALLTDAFDVLTTMHTTNGSGSGSVGAPVNAQTVLSIVQQFSEAAGSMGMVSGQTQDMKAGSDINLEQLFQIHYLKTGKLIENSITSVALLAQVNAMEFDRFKTFGKNLGLAFQIKDDILDTQDNDQESKSFPSLIGLDKSNEQLRIVTDVARDALKKLNGYDLAALELILNYNIDRKK